MTCILWGLRSRFELPWCFNEASDPLVFSMLKVLKDLISSPPVPSLICLQLFTWFVLEWSTTALKITFSWILFSHNGFICVRRLLRPWRVQGRRCYRTLNRVAMLGGGRTIYFTEVTKGQLRYRWLRAFTSNGAHFRTLRSCHCL